MSGMASLIGYGPDDDPRGSGSAYVGAIGGVTGAAAALTSLLLARRDGRARRVEVAQRGAAMHWIGEEIVAAVNRRATPAQVGKDVDPRMPRRAYRCAGDDEWLAVDVRTERYWAALTSLVGRADLGDVVWQSEERTAAAEQLTRLLDRCAGARRIGVVAAVLQNAGVPAAHVQNGRDLAEAPQLADRHWFTTLEHPACGVHPYGGLPLEADGVLITLRGAAPALGAETSSIAPAPIQPR